MVIMDIAHSEVNGLELIQRLHMNDFIQDTKHHIEKIMKIWNNLPLSEMEHAEIFLAMTKQIEIYQEQLEQGLDDNMER